MGTLGRPRFRPRAALFAGVSALGLALSPLAPAVAQVMPVNLALEGARGCDADALEDRLLAGHPLGAAASPDAVCPSPERFSWVPSLRMTPRERSAFRAAVDQLIVEPQVGVCRTVGMAMRDLDRSDRVRVWAEPDTAQGLVYYGATYVTPDAVPLAVHFWSAAFERSPQWLVAALAHEGYHAIRPDASEGEAVRVGRACGFRSSGSWASVGSSGGR